MLRPPFVCSSSARGAGWAGCPPGLGHPEHARYTVLSGGARAVQSSRPRRAAGLASPRPTVATVLQVPHPCAWRGLEARGGGERSKAVPSSLCAQPRRPRSASGGIRAPWPRPGSRHVAKPGARPPGSSGTHSGAAAGPASWGLSGLPAPRPARSPRLCRASVRPAGSQPSRAGEGKNPAGEIRTPAAAPSCLAAGGPDLGAGRAGTAGAGPPRPPAHWASPGLGGSRPRGTRPPARSPPFHSRRGKPSWTGAPQRARVGAEGLGEPLARLNAPLQDAPLQPGLSAADTSA